MRTEDPSQDDPRRAVGIRDVAELAGVSIATVSRTLAAPDLVKAETRDRVLAAVRATHYTPNLSGRSLRAKRTMAVLVVFSNIAGAFISEIMRGIDDILFAHDYAMIVGTLDNRLDHLQRYIDLVAAGGCDGVILHAGNMSRDTARTFAETRVPRVAISVPTEGSDIPCVLVDDRAAAINVVRTFVALGHRRIAYLSGRPGNYNEIERYAGFCRAIAECGLDHTLCPRFEGDYSVLGGARAAESFLTLPNRPTAIFAASDESALGFMGVIRRAGLHIPGDVSVIGFDGIEYGDFIEPRLSTVVQPRRAMGRTAAELLISRIRGEPAGEALIRLPTALTLKGTTAPPATS